jgi:hypothetical protein
MTPDQRIRLLALSEKLADVAISELDPDAWPGADVELADWTQQIRGDRFWSKKNGAATLMLLGAIDKLTEVGAPTDPIANDGLDAQIADAEKRASKLVDAALRKVGNRDRQKH